ncbi:MAG TPA: type II toxin-antitoxin system prevent-host-death family antitoxin [Stellaceae bacterium]
MAAIKQVVASAGDLARRFSRYSDIALAQPVMVTKNGRPRNVLISVTEYERLKKQDRLTFLAADTPEEFLPAIRALARGKKR